MGDSPPAPPESGGAIVRQMLTGHGGTLQGHVNDNVLNSQAVQRSFNRYGDYFLSQAFPEGSPTHPAYPTGHGTVAGACITVLKFFFDGNFVIPNPVVPSSDGLSLQPYTGGDAGQITVNGELNKIANNISLAMESTPASIGAATPPPPSNWARPWQSACFRIGQGATPRDSALA
jgi:hypothetical protein